MISDLEALQHRIEAELAAWVNLRRSIERWCEHGLRLQALMDITVDRLTVAQQELHAIGERMQAEEDGADWWKGDGDV